MPRPRKTIEEHLKSGSYRPCLHGPLPEDLAKWRSGDGPPPAPPKKPKGLSKEASKFWDEVVRTRGVAIRESDVFVLRLLANLWVRLQRAEEAVENDPTKEAWIVYGIAIDKFGQVAKEFGLTPKSRAAMPAAEPAGPAKPKVATRPKTKLDEAPPPTPTEEPT